MSNRSRAARIDPSATSPQTTRPRIWVEGHQRPRFDLRAYLATSVGMARRDLDPAIIEAAERLLGFGQRVQQGDVRLSVAWAGRAARVIPSHARVGGWLIGLSHLLSDSRRLLLPDEDPEAPIAYPNLAPTNLAPTNLAPEPEPAPPPRAGIEPTLHAIRAAIGATPTEGRQKQPPQAQPSEPRSPGPVKRALWAGATRGTLAVLLIFALPGGAVKALLFHLDGGDLADWS